MYYGYGYPNKGAIMFPQSSLYALRMVIYLAKSQNGSPKKVKDIAGEIKIPEAYLHKIVQALVRNGLLDSKRGPRGGISLKKSGSEINAYEVINSVDQESTYAQCFFGFSECNRLKPCPFHVEWESIVDRIDNLLKSRSIQEISEITDLDHITDLKNIPIS